MTDTNPRDLIKRMADELDHYRQLLMDDRRETHALAAEARAYLAQTEPTLTVEDCSNMHKHSATNRSMTELSPAAQALLSAYHEEAIDYIEEWGSFRHKRGLAAVLEAAADQVVPEHKPWLRTGGGPAARHKVRLELLAIAAELRGQDQPISEGPQ